jgi:signal transduction histidine kinase/putative methionine-R-sulfoxide reductase with GAF domain/HAMP domain-containing protein
MTKDQSSKSKHEKRVEAHIETRIKSLFSGQEGPPTFLSIQQVDALKARLAELEGQLSRQGAVTGLRPPASVGGKVLQPSPVKSAKPGRTGFGKPVIAEERQKRIALWTAAIFAAISLALLVFSFYMVYVVGEGKPDLSDKTLEPVAGLMLIASLISFFLIRRNRLARATWIMFLIVIIPPVPAVLVLNDIFAVLILYITVMASILITWVLPKTSRRQAILATGVSILSIIGIQAWNPAFRVGSSTFPDFTGYITILAALAIFAFFIRQAFAGNIRTKLIVALVTIAVVSIAVVAFSAQRSLSTSLTENIGSNLIKLAGAQSVDIGLALDRELNAVKVLARTNAVQEKALIANRAAQLSPAVIEQYDQQWKAADAAGNNLDPLVAGVLYNDLSAELRQFREGFPQHVEVFLTDLQGLSIASTNRTSDYNQADEEWWQTAYQEGLFIGQPEYDESSKTIALNMAVAVRENGTGRLLGVLRTTVNFTTLTESLAAGLFGQTGRTNIYLPDGRELRLRAKQDGTFELIQEEAPPEVKALAQSAERYQEISLNGTPTLAGQSNMVIPGNPEDSAVIALLDWRVLTLQDQAEALQPVAVQTRNIIVLAIAIALGVVLAAVGLARVISGPILRLNAVAGKVAAGDLTVEAKVESQDEIGTLASTFNNMTAQLRDLFGSLEQRVLDRTHDLELASEVGRTITEKVANLDEMLTASVEMIRSRFDLYYTQVYLTDPAGRVLTLRAGTGEVGKELLKRGHHLPINTNSLNGRAVTEKKTVIVADTGKASDFLPNPLLPNTRSEMAVPLIAGGRVTGVLDMQSEHPDYLNETNQPAFEALAGQLAVALQNAALFTQAEEARSEVEAQVRRTTEQGWGDFLDAIERGHRIGFAFNQADVVPLEAEALSMSRKSFDAPITVTGAKVGAIQLGPDSDRPLTNSETELIRVTAQQLGQHIENLRLLAQAKRYQIQAEQAARRLTREGWETLQASSDFTPGYHYNLNEVKLLSDNGNGNSGGTLKQPLIVRDETIGELAVDVESNSDEAGEIISAVSQQLSIHLETLRLTEELQKRARELQELDRLKTAFLANMSHELRTPLNSILGFADVILEELDGPLTDPMSNDLQLIQKNGQHLLHLINDVLDMAKIEAGRMNLAPEKFKVHEILDEVVSITSPLASEKSLSLFIETDSDPQVEVFADRTRIRQVMINLVNNAMKFTDKGRISLRVVGRDENALISVSDTGIGILAGQLEAVFQEFTQVDTSATRKVGGTGLGLPISRRLVEMHGGRLWAESTGVPGEGSTFYVELPLEARITEPIEKMTK